MRLSTEFSHQRQCDYESADQIFARLEEHVTKSPEATFTFDGTTDVARQRVGAWRSVIEHERLVGSYGYTDGRTRQ